MTLVEFVRARLADAEECAQLDLEYYAFPMSPQERNIVKWAEVTLAQVQAHRRVLSLLSGAEFARDCHPDDAGEQGHAAGIRKAVALLALPYADHPDFREEWRSE